jgi:hypothetical protein
MGKLVGLISSGIGLASEAMAAHKQPRPNTNANAGESSTGSYIAQRAVINEPPPEYIEVPDRDAEQLIASGKAFPAEDKGSEKFTQRGYDDGTTSEEGDEEQWALDDAVEDRSPERQEETIEDANQLTDNFMRSHPPPAYAGSMQIRGRLPCPVIIPQRRPRDKKRGFVRAYAPVLADCGIDQAMFLDFLKTFHSASKASPWLNVVNAAAMGAGLAPSGIVMGVSMAVQVVAKTAIEVQARTRYS